MKFHYTATDQEGKILDGDIDAGNTTEVISFLSSSGLRPISIKSAGHDEFRGVQRFFNRPMTLQDKVFLTKYLALMLRVGTDIYSAVDILISDFDKPAVKLFLLEVKDTLVKGKPLYSAFEKYPAYFSPVFVNMVKAGESSGNLDKTFETLSVSLEKEGNLRKKITGALIYPTILISISLLIMLVLVSFALPKIAELFSSTSIKPPLFSRIIFAIGLFFGRNIFIILPLLFGSVFGGFFFLRRTDLGRRYFNRIINRTPFVNQVVLKIAVQRFAATLSSLLKSGIPVVQALEITAPAVGMPELSAAILRARDSVTKGLTLGEAFQRETFFPKVVVNLISVSEKAGHIEDILQTLSEFYETEIEISIKTMLSVVEPLLLVLIGGLVGIIALSIIVPIYQLIGAV